jgi:hypothetical protein
MTAFPPDGVDAGDLRARLAGLVRQPFDGPVSTPTVAYANAVADAVLADGFRRVVEDDATVDRIARVLISVRLPDGCDELDVWRAWHRLSNRERHGWRESARAVVRALREET